MSCILKVDDDDNVNNINIDELYETQHRKDLKQLSIFNKILNRVHRQIKTHLRIKKTTKFIWFTVPEFLFGEPLYDKAECVAFLVSKLQDNGFDVRYMYPNTLYVSWERWIPSYKRFELKTKFGINVDEKGNIIEKKEDLDDEMLNPKKDEKQGKQYTPIDAYRPTGNLVYHRDIFDKIERKMQQPDGGSGGGGNGGGGGSGNGGAWGQGGAGNRRVSFNM